MVFGVSYLPNQVDGNEFYLLTQLMLPFLSGMLGGIALMLVYSMQNEDKFFQYISFKFAIIGALAGILAVNLLNPSGSIAQVMVLSFIAGLSGVSYLKRNALVDDNHEEIIFNRLLKMIDTNKLQGYASPSEENRIAELMFSGIYYFNACEVNFDKTNLTDQQVEDKEDEINNKFKKSLSKYVKGNWKNIKIDDLKKFVDDFVSEQSK